MDYTRCPEKRGHSFFWDIDTDPLSLLVSEIFDLKIADKQTYIQTSTRTDNKGRLKLSAGELINADCSLIENQCLQHVTPP